MTVHMITSRQNTAHVTADDEAHLNARMMGDGQYLLTKDWTPSFASASTVKLPVGEWLWNGRYIRISSQETVNIGNGVSGSSSRDDLICFHYSRNSSTGVETVTLTVVEGVINQGIGVPPITTSLLNTPSETYMIIAVVHWKGLTPSVQAFENTEYLQPFSQTNETLRNLDYRLTHTTTTTTITARLPYMDRPVTLRKTGNLVVVSEQVLTGGSGANAHFNASETIPDGYRPAVQGVITCIDNSSTVASLFVNSRGGIEVNGNFTQSRYLQVLGVWFTA